MKKSLKKFIWDKLDKGEYILDKDVAKFLEDEPNFCLVEFYKLQWRGFNNAKEYFKDLVESKNYSIKKIDRFPRNNKHLIRDNNWQENEFKAIPKSYYDYLKKIGAKII